MQKREQDIWSKQPPVHGGAAATGGVQRLLHLAIERRQPRHPAQLSRHGSGDFHVRLSPVKQVADCADAVVITRDRGHEDDRAAVNGVKTNKGHDMRNTTQPRP
jgi:hypothetical protein